RNISYGSDIPSSEPRTSSAPKSSSASSMETCRYRSASLMRQGIPSRAATKGRSGIREAISRERSDSPTPGACTGASASSAMAAAPHDDPFFEHLFAPLYEAFFDDPTNAAKKAALYFLPNCNPVTGGARATVTMEMGFPFIRYEGPTVTSPPDRSDMRYARWYPTALTLPNNKVLVLSGVDQNESLGTTKPTKIDPATGRKVLDLDPVSGYTKDALTDGPFRDSVIFQVVPEIYDPEADRTRAL